MRGPNVVRGGDNQMFARYLASRYRGTTDDKPKEVDCILVTHGDEFDGIVQQVTSITGNPRSSRR